MILVSHLCSCAEWLRVVHIYGTDSRISHHSVWHLGKQSTSAADSWCMLRIRRVDMNMIWSIHGIYDIYNYIVESSLLFCRGISHPATVIVGSPLMPEICIFLYYSFSGNLHMYIFFDICSIEIIIIILFNFRWYSGEWTLCGVSVYI